MADPLSIAGSIAGLISICDVVFQKLHRYVREVKSAEKEVQELKNEVANLSGVLHNLRLIAEDLEADDTQQYSLRLDEVNSTLSILHELNDMLKKIGLPDSGKCRETLRRLIWPFKAIKVKEFLDSIRQHRDNLTLALTADSMTALLISLSFQEDISAQLVDIDARLRDREKIETRIALDEERERILTYFLSVDPQPNFQTSVKLRYPTTGFWLKAEKTFSDWMRDWNTNIWLSGIPGSGKTVLSGLVIQDCLERSTIDRAVAFFYCDYKDSQTHVITNLLSTLASQIGRQNEASFQILKGYYAKLHPQNRLRGSLEAEELVSIIRKMSATFDDVRIIVDGLDECGDTTGDVCRYLSRLFGSGTISLALLSRDESDIRDTLVAQCGHIEISARSKDVDHYVRSEIEDRISKHRLRLHSADLKKEIISELVNSANGMYVLGFLAWIYPLTTRK